LIRNSDGNRLAENEGKCGTDVREIGTKEKRTFCKRRRVCGYPFKWKRVMSISSDQDKWCLGDCICHVLA